MARRRGGGGLDADDNDGASESSSTATPLIAPRTSLSKKLGLALFLCFLVMFSLVVTLAVLLTSHVESDTDTAVCEFHEGFAINKQHNVTGAITLEADMEGVKFKYAVRGLLPGRKQAAFIHARGGSARAGADKESIRAATGPVFNPGHAEHGCFTQLRRRAGDIENLSADAQGAATGESSQSDVLIRFDGDWGVVGRAIVIYEHEDKCENAEDTANTSTPYGMCQIVISKSA